MRFIDYEIANVYTQRPGNWAKSPEIPPRYDVRLIDCEEFHSRLPDDLAHVDYEWAFERGDLCIASLFDGQVVGWDFSTYTSTRVNSHIDFRVPEGYEYGYGNFTHPDHRGRKLADMRAARWEGLLDEYESSVWYVNRRNERSLKVFGEPAEGVELIGWTAYIGFFSCYLAFSSKSCRNLGVGFCRASLR